jgi:hydroxymethylglutaryl-CoA lyase
MGDEYSEEVLLSWAEEMVSRDINIISLADTVGVATPDQISFALRTLIPRYPQVTWGVHLHAAPGNIDVKLKAALDAGCRRFDGALKGIGGCPMADDELVGNMDTEKMITCFEAAGFETALNKKALTDASLLAVSVFR